MENLLTTDTATEKIIYQAKIHWISYIFPIIMMIIGLPGLVLAFLGILTSMYSIVTGLALAISLIFFKGLLGYLRNKKMVIKLSEKHLTVTTGLLNRTTVDVPVEKLEGIILNQTLLGQKLNYATLVLTTGDLAQRIMIENPKELRSYLMR